MKNRLSEETSPYLLQHADNPVDWYPWGQEALERSKKEDKPIFLSIGYAACHWCHVMAHESFEDADTAAIMNEFFINIKVDREERPDLDNIYMSAVVAMTGQGGWPMSMFLTPAGEPFFGGTYFPPERRYNMPSFREVLTSVAEAWHQRRDQVIENGQKMVKHIQGAIHLGDPVETLQQEFSEQAAFKLAQSYDWKNGGWGAAPKFPQAMVIEFLLRRASREDKLAEDIAIHALQSMARGGMYDLIGGGFARYSVDDEWLVPHFEKMLYDNAQLSITYLYAFLLSGNEAMREICEETLDFILREMTHPEGGFFSSLDADSEGHEGKYYVWTAAEVQAVLTDDEYQFFLATHTLSENGNFEGKNVIRRSGADQELVEYLKTDTDAFRARMKGVYQKLLDNRERRIRPDEDDKVLVSWNALCLRAFSETARYLKRDDYYQAAVKNADFLLSTLVKDGKLYRSWRKGSTNHNAFLEDHAALIIALLSLYQTDGDPRWYRNAVEFGSEMITHFIDDDWGFYDTHDDHEKLITRPKDIQDNATPSGNALAAMAMLQLSALSGNGEYRALAEGMLSHIQSSFARYPTAFGYWLCAIDFALHPVREIAILGESGNPVFQALVDTLWERYRPDIVSAYGTPPFPDDAPELLHNRAMLNELPTAYVCQNFVCLNPVQQVEAFRSLLDSKESNHAKTGSS